MQGLTKGRLVSQSLALSRNLTWSRMGSFPLTLSMTLAIAASFFLATPHEAFAVTPCDPSTSECRNPFLLPTSPTFVNYFSNYKMDVPNSSIKRVIIAIEGNGRNAKSMYSSVYSAAKAQKVLAETLIIAPWFKGNDYLGISLCLDGNCDAVETNEVYWSTDGWKEGENALVSPYLSSFDLTDLMIETLVSSKLFTSLETIVVTGHSAGGQYTQRYAVGTTVEQRVTPISVEYLVANPSSYLYLDNKRADWAGLYTLGGKYPEYGLNALTPTIPSFVDPYSRATSPFLTLTDFATLRNSLNSKSGSLCTCSSTPCPYERFKYGFDMKPRDPGHYMCFEDTYQSCNRPNTTPTTVTDQTSRFLGKKVTYLLGQLDNSTPTGSPDSNTDLDVSCSGNFQGPDRLSRGTFYYESLGRFGNHNHRMLFAARAGHSASQIYQSYQAKRTLFGGELPTKEYISPVITLKQKITNRYLGASETSPYAAITQSSVQGSLQRWIISKVSANEYTLQQEKNLRYLGAATSSSYGASTQEYKNSPVQRWLITPVSNQPQTYRIQQSPNGRYLDANTSSGYSVNTQPLQADDSQLWILQP